MRTPTATCQATRRYISSMIYDDECSALVLSSFLFSTRQSPKAQKPSLILTAQHLFFRSGGHFSLSSTPLFPFFFLGFLSHGSPAWLWASAIRVKVYSTTSRVLISPPSQAVKITTHPIDRQRRHTRHAPSSHIRHIKASWPCSRTHKKESEPRPNCTPEACVPALVDGLPAAHARRAAARAANMRSRRRRMGGAARAGGRPYEKSSLNLLTSFCLRV